MSFHDSPLKFQADVPSRDRRRAMAALSFSHNSSSSLFAKICSGCAVSDPTADTLSSPGRDQVYSTHKVLSAFVNRYQHSVAPFRPACSRRSTNSRGNLASPSLEPNVPWSEAMQSSVSEWGLTNRIARRGLVFPTLLTKVVAVSDHGSRLRGSG